MIIFYKVPQDLSIPDFYNTTCICDVCWKDHFNRLIYKRLKLRLK